MIQRVRSMFASWMDAKPRPRMRLPTALQFPINDICNSRCQMCHIWQQKRDVEITPAEVRRVLADPLFRRVTSVGINGGEPTLRSDLDEVVAAVVETLPAIESISLISNGLRSERVISAIERVGRICRQADVHLDVMVSLDGVGEVHDRVRGVAGNFEQSVRVIDYVRQSPWVSSSRIGCTIIAENVYSVEDVLDFAQSKGIYARFRLGVPHPRLYSDHLTEPFSLHAGAVFHLACFLDTLVLTYERDPGRRAFYKSLRNQIVYGQSRTAGCAWKNRGVTLSPRGELAYCAVASPSLGNALQKSANDIYWGNSQVLEGILTNKCSGCRHDYDGVGDRRVLIEQWRTRVIRKLPPPAVRLLRSARQWNRTRSEWRMVRDSTKSPRTSSSPAVGRSILLCGWYGTETLGDRAILAGVCWLLSGEFPGVPMDLASLEPYVSEETCRLMPGLGLRRVIDLKTARKEIEQSEYGVIAIAGGPLMTPVREVIDLMNLFELGRRFGSKTVILGCGLGPLASNGPRRRAVAHLVTRADSCVFRDEASVSLALKLGRNRPLKGSVDPAFFWPALRQIPPEGERRKGTVIALALRDWSIEEYAADLPPDDAVRLKSRFEDELLKMVDVILRRDGCSIDLVCMHTMTVGGDDRRFYQRLFQSRAALLGRIQWRRRSPIDELNILRNADGVVAMRFHACVLSLALKKPFVALDYTRGGKIAGLLADSMNDDRRFDLVTFEGVAAAERLLADIGEGNLPNPVDVDLALGTYRACLTEIREELQTGASGVQMARG